MIQQAKQALRFGETPGLKQLHSALTPAQSVRPFRPRLPERETSDGYIVGFWQLRRRLSRLHWRDAQGIFAAWRLAIKLRAAKRRLDQHLRRTKRAQILAVLGDAEEAARGKLMGSFYKYVNLLCPKTSMQRIRLRNQSGELLSAKAVRAICLLTMPRRCSLGSPGCCHHFSRCLLICSQLRDGCRHFGTFPGRKLFQSSRQALAVGKIRLHIAVRFSQPSPPIASPPNSRSSLPSGPQSRLPGYPNPTNPLPHLPTYEPLDLCLGTTRLCFTSLNHTSRTRSC